MNYDFIVKLNAFPVKFSGLNGARVIYELTTRQLATGFTNESDAWLAARDYGLKIDHCKVEQRGVPA